ncbi:unnamed protein product [Parnassius apollo]|nr:unnamed protein product [Parnassius apollo]
MEGNTSHKENLDPVTPMQDPVISTNPVVIKKRAETFLGGALADKKKTKGILREEIQENRPQRAITFTEFEKIVGQNIVSRLTSETPDKSNCFYKALKDIYDHLKGKNIEQEDSTISSDYLVIENKLMAINDIPIVISNSNNIEESHTDTIETETTENTELPTTDLFDDLKTLNLTESYNLSADIRNTIEMNNNYKQSQLIANSDSDTQNYLKNEIFNVLEPTSDNVVKGPNQLMSPKLTAIAEMHNVDKPSESTATVNVLNKESNEITNPNLLVIDNVTETINKSNINNQNQIAETENNKKYDFNFGNAKCDSEMTPPKLKEILNWPQTPQRKGKIMTHNPIYVLTSRKWLEIEEKKKNEKKTKEKEKEERKKRERREKKTVKSVTKISKHTKNMKIDSENLENIEILRQKEKVPRHLLNKNSKIEENNRKNKEETKTEIKERKRKYDKSITTAYNKKIKIDVCDKETENNIFKCDDTKTELLDIDQIKKTTPKPNKESNIKILSVVKAPVMHNPRNIFNENSCVDTKVPFVLSKPKSILNRRETFRNEEELSNFLNDEYLNMDESSM